MKKYFNCFLLAALASLLFLSCQKELYFDDNQLSAGTLKSDTSGNCLPHTIAGTYMQNRDLADSNYILVQVSINTAGIYYIATDTVNGYSFAASGTFSNAGAASVRLEGSGKPIATGNNNFTVRYGNSQCLLGVNVVLPTDSILPAAYTLAGAPATCTPATIAGSYIKDIPLDAAEDSITIALQVSIPGSYAIATNTVNGYSFSGAGTVAGTGVQIVTLRPIGTPVNAGSDNFTIAAGASSCSFSVTVTTAVAVTNTDYFPLTPNSYWVYGNISIAADTLTRRINGSSTASGNSYAIMDETDRFGTRQQYLFRKAGSNYFDFGSVDQYTHSFGYVPRVDGDINFLKQNLSSGDEWTSTEYVGTLFSGQPIYLQYFYACLSANSTATINGKSFINVYKIRLLPSVRSSTAYAYNSTGETIDLWYAKGIGLIYKSTTVGMSKTELNIKNWLVN